MTTFDNREKAFENRHVHDEHTRFVIAARANKKLGQWAADLLGKTGADADAYAIEVVKSDFEEAGHEDVVRKVTADLDGKADADTVRAKLVELTEKATIKMLAKYSND